MIGNGGAVADNAAAEAVNGGADSGIKDADTAIDDDGIVVALTDNGDAALCGGGCVISDIDVCVGVTVWHKPVCCNTFCILCGTVCTVGIECRLTADGAAAAAGFLSMFDSGNSLCLWCEYRLLRTIGDANAADVSSGCGCSVILRSTSTEKHDKSKLEFSSRDKEQ